MTSRTFRIAAVLALLLPIAPGCASTSPSALFTQGLAADVEAWRTDGPGPAATYSERREAAIEAYEAACVGGAEAGCLFFERLMTAMRPRYDEFIAAESEFKPRCHAGDARACFRWGRLYDDGNGMGIDPVQAMMLYERSCLQGYDYACQKSAKLHLVVDWSPMSNQQTRARTRRSCKAGYGRACLVDGNLAKMGRGGPRDRPLSRRLLAQACRRGQFEACDRMAIWWINRNELPKATALLSELYGPMTDACRQGHPLGCMLASRLSEQPALKEISPDFANVLVAACLDGNVRSACAASIASQGWRARPAAEQAGLRRRIKMQLKTLPKEPSPTVIPRRADRARWRAFFKDRCYTGRSLVACSRLAGLASTPAQADKARAQVETLGEAHYQRSLTKRLAGCADDDAFDCYEAANLLRMRKADEARAVRLKAKAVRLEAKIRKSYGPNNDG